MREEDLRQISRRLEEVTFICERGYEPCNDFGELLWVKSHEGSVHTHAGAIRDIARDQGRRHPT